MIDVVVADDQALIRQAVVDLIEHEPGMRVVGTAVNGIEAVRLAEQLRPDVIVMDVRMPLMDGIEATRAICGTAPAAASPAPADASPRVLILTTFEDDPDYVVRGVQSGAAGFVGKSAEPERIREAIRTVHRGEGLLSPRATRHLLDRHSGADARGEAGARRHPDLAPLTDRELDVLREVALGRTNAEIADRLGISVATVKTHLNRTMTKVARPDRAQLVVLAYETGLVTPRYR